MPGCYQINSKNSIKRPCFSSILNLHSLFKQSALVAFLWVLIFMDNQSFVSTDKKTDASIATLQLLSLQVAVENSQSASNTTPNRTPPTQQLSAELQSSVAEATDKMMQNQTGFIQPQQRSQPDLARSIDPDSDTLYTQDTLNTSNIPQQLQDSIATLVAYPKDKQDTSIVAADVVNAVMGLVNGAIQNSNLDSNLNLNSNQNIIPKYQQGYDGSEVDLLAMMAIGDLQAILKAIQGWALEGQYGKTVGFVQVALEKELQNELIDVFTYIFENWSINYESLALQLMAVLQSDVKQQTLDIVINAIVQAKNDTIIIELFKYAFLDAQEPIGLAFAELTARSAKGENCRLGKILDQVTFAISPNKFQNVIELLEKVNGDVCIFSFVQTLDVSRGIEKNSVYEAASAQDCVEVPPPGGYTCAQQLQFDKCERYWMVQGGYCQVTCGTCGSNACVDVQPTSQYTCAEQKQFGKCQADWMVQGGYCNFTCDRCPASSYTSPPPVPQIVLSPIPLPTILQPPSPSELLPTNIEIPVECDAIYNQTVDIIAVMLNEVVNRIAASLQT